MNSMVIGFGRFRLTAVIVALLRAPPTSAQDRVPLKDEVHQALRLQDDAE